MAKSKQDTPKDKDILETLDYGAGSTPSTGALASLAVGVRDLTGACGVVSLAVAVLLDQGRAVDAIALVARDLEEQQADAKAKRRAAAERRERGMA